nr:hypothetical protein Iba_scaffold83197CG0010 [Ipomoea batatas]GME12516.1 hypothetical protein Iba_scaffold13903CG0010 [Ipomoea batatas]
MGRERIQESQGKHRLHHSRLLPTMTTCFHVVRLIIIVVVEIGKTVVRGTRATAAADAYANRILPGRDDVRNFLHNFFLDLHGGVEAIPILNCKESESDRETRVFREYVEINLDD